MPWIYQRRRRAHTVLAGRKRTWDERGKQSERDIIIVENRWVEGETKMEEKSEKPAAETNTRWSRRETSGYLGVRVSSFDPLSLLSRRSQEIPTCPCFNCKGARGEEREPACIHTYILPASPCIPANGREDILSAGAFPLAPTPF